MRPGPVVVPLRLSSSSRRPSTRKNGLHGYRGRAFGIAFFTCPGLASPGGWAVPQPHGLDGIGDREPTAVGRKGGHHARQQRYTHTIIVAAEQTVIECAMEGLDRHLAQLTPAAAEMTLASVEASNSSEARPFVYARSPQSWGVAATRRGAVAVCLQVLHVLVRIGPTGPTGAARSRLRVTHPVRRHGAAVSSRERSPRRLATAAQARHAVRVTADGLS